MPIASGIKQSRITTVSYTHLAVLNGKQLELFDVLDADGKKTGVVRERSLVHMDGVPHRTAHILSLIHI